VFGYEITYLAECAIAPLKLPSLSYVIIYADILGVANVAWVTGDRLQGGKYTIERELGRGRFGITYLVKNRNSDRQVIKTLNDVLVRSLTHQERERLKTMFLREALKLQKCKHKYIVEVTDSFEEADRLCLVMEYVDGVSLADRRQQKLSEEVALQYIQQIGEALIVVHENRLIHRDVHPGNIFLRVRDGQPESVILRHCCINSYQDLRTPSRITNRRGRRGHGGMKV